MIWSHSLENITPHLILYETPKWRNSLLHQSYWFVFPWFVDRIHHSKNHLVHVDWLIAQSEEDSPITAAPMFLLLWLVQTCSNPFVIAGSPVCSMELRDGCHHHQESFVSLKRTSLCASRGINFNRASHDRFNLKTIFTIVSESGTPTKNAAGLRVVQY